MIGRGSRSISRERHDSIFAYKMMAPMLIMFTCFGLFPILYSFYLSFLNWKLNINRPVTFIGLENYIKAFNDKLFMQSMPKTLYFVLIVIFGSTLIGFLFASLVNSKCVKGKQWFIIISLLPWAIPKVVGGLMWKWIFDGNYGILNVVLKGIGVIDEFQWWFNKSAWFSLLMCAIVEIWRLAPFSGLLLFAGLQGIPKQQYEAAEIDGANPLQRFAFITFPGLRPVFMSILILLTTWSLKTFDTIYMLTMGGPGDKTMISYIYIYLQAFNYQNISYGSALGYLFTIVILGMIVVYYKVLGKDNAI